MPSIGTNRKNFETAKEQGNLVPVEKSIVVNPTPPIPTYPDAPNANLRTPLPAISVQQPDMQRQWQTGATPQQRISPMSLTSNPVVGAQTISNIIQTQVAGSSASATVTDIESISINKQTGTAYNVNLSDRDTLITLNNNAGGTVTLPGPGGSSFAFIQSGHTLSVASDLATVTLTNGSKNLMFLIAWSGRSFTNTTFTVSDTNGNVWNQLYSVGDPGGTTQTAWYAEGIAAGANTVTVLAVHGLGGAAQTDVTIVEYSGIKPSGSLDAFSIGFNTSTNITTFTANDLVIFSAAGASGGGHAVLAPWTLRYDDGFQIVQDQTIASPGTLINCVGANSPEVTNGDPRALAAFKPSLPLASFGFVAGWYTFIQNTGTGTFVLQSNALIDGSGASVNIGPNQGLLVVYDGTNWFTERGISFPNGTTGSGAVVLAGSPTLTGTAALPIVTLTGKITNYNSIATVSDGVPAEYATADLSGQAAAIAATTLYAVPTIGQGMYRVSWVAKVTQGATTSSVLGGANGFQLVYTDNDDSTVTTTPAWWGGGNNGAAPTSAAVNTTQGQISGCFVVNAKASTNIQYSIGYTSAGATPMQYNLHIKLEAL